MCFIRKVEFSIYLFLVSQMLRVEDLHEAYNVASEEERIQMANLGAICWLSLKQELYDKWNASLSTDDNLKAEMWRAEGVKEGRQAMLDSLKTKLASAEFLADQIKSIEESRENERQRAEKRLEYETTLLTQEISKSEARFVEYRKTIENDIDKRIDESLVLRCKTITETKNQEIESLQHQLSMLQSQLLSVENARLVESQRHSQEIEKRLIDEVRLRVSEIEIAKEKEISSLHKQITSFQSQTTLLSMANESLSLMREKISNLETERYALQETLATLTVTKSSHQIGKDGETTVIGLIEKYILPEFLYSSVVDVSHLPHSADCHIHFMSPLGKKMKILVDSKKYKESVRTKEVVKLHNDVDADDEATAGIMISLDSVISSVKQFQVEKTPKGKFILYLSMSDIDEQYKGKTLCWATRIISTLASFTNNSKELDKISAFMKDLESSSKDVDATFKACQKATDLAKIAKENLTKRLIDFRIDDDVIIPTPDASIPPPKKQRKKATKSPSDHIVS